MLFDVAQEERELKWVRRGFRVGRMLMVLGLTRHMSTTEGAWSLHSETCLVRSPGCEERTCAWSRAREL